MQFKYSSSNISTEEFKQAIARINLVAIAQFFEAICTGIFKRLLAAGFTKNELVWPVLIYFGKIEINN